MMSNVMCSSGIAALPDQFPVCVTVVDGGVLDAGDKGRDEARVSFDLPGDGGCGGNVGSVVEDGRETVLAGGVRVHIVIVLIVRVAHFGVERGGDADSAFRTVGHLGPVELFQILDSGAERLGGGFGLRCAHS